MEPITEVPKRPLPMAVGFFGILLCLSAGGWIAHYYVHTGSMVAHDTVIGELPPDNSTRGVFPRGNGALEIRTERARAMVGLSGDRAVITSLMYSGGPVSLSFMPDEVRVTMANVRTLAEKKANYDRAKLTGSEIQRLRSLSYPGNGLPIVANQADRDRLLADFVAYEKTTDAKDKLAAEMALLSTLDDVAARNQEATKKDGLDRVEKINQIMTPDKWKLIQ